jgi:hypothetical protein
MKRMLGAAAVAALMTAMPAQAAQLVITMTGNSATSGTDGNSRIYTKTANGSTVNVRATGWSYDGSTVRDSFLGSYGGGLGVTSGDETGSGNTHVIDNQNRIDFVLLQFDQVVRLTAATFNGFSFGGVTDTDASIAWGGSATPWNMGLALDNQSGSALAAMFSGSALSLGGANGGNRPLNLGDSAAGNLWLIGAAFTNADRRIDGFKLGNVTVNTVSPVPEPSTWAMMLAGFALVGVAMRRAIRSSEQRFTDKVRRIALSGG